MQGEAAVNTFSSIKWFSNALNKRDLPITRMVEPNHKHSNVFLINSVFIISDSGEATLRIIGAASEDDGVYTCIATNELGSVTSSASLRVLGKRVKHPIVHHPCEE